jgi:hypothetical protein
LILPASGIITDNTLALCRAAQTPSRSFGRYHARPSDCESIIALYQLAGSPSSGRIICVNREMHLSFNPHLTISTNHPRLSNPLPLRDLSIIYPSFMKSTYFLTIYLPPFYPFHLPRSKTLLQPSLPL